MTTATGATTVETLIGQPVEFRSTPGRAEGALVVLPGAHMPADCRFGEEAYAGDRQVLVLSRPGYGRTAVTAGPTPADFADRAAALIHRRGLSDVTVIGISMGARSAYALAAAAPDLVSRLVLMCPVSFLPWPESDRVRRMSRLLFSPRTQRATWGLAHTLLRRGGDRALARLVSGLTNLPPREAVARLGSDRPAATRFLLACRSGRGWTVDLRDPGPVPRPIRQPVLVLATRHDGSVDLRHPEHLAATLPSARLVDVGTPTHLVWLGEGSARTRSEVASFLDG